MAATSTKAKMKMMKIRYEMSFTFTEIEMTFFSIEGSEFSQVKEHFCGKRSVQLIVSH